MSHRTGLLLALTACGEVNGVGSVAKRVVCVLEWERIDNEMREEEKEASWNCFKLILALNSF